MGKQKKQRLSRAGWRVGSTEELLGLSADESAFIVLELSASDDLSARRVARGVTQVELAERLGSSQSRVAKIEAKGPSLTLDLLFRAYLALGATPRDLAKVITQRRGAA